MGWMHPDALAAVETFERDRAEGRAQGRVPSSFGVRRLGSLALVTVGNTVWTDPEKRRNHHDEPLGGIVLAIDLVEHRDVETGEITVERRFRCYDPHADWRHAFCWFPESAIPADGAELTHFDDLVRAVRRFCREIAGSGASLLSSNEAQLVNDAFHMAAVVSPGGAH